MTSEQSSEEREQEIREQIREAMGPGLSVRKEVRYLPDIMDDDEVVKGAARGVMKGDTWLVVCTDRRVVFVNKGLLWGLKQTEIGLDAISSVSHQTKITMASVEILGAGLSNVKIKNVEKESAVRFARAVQAARREFMS